MKKLISFITICIFVFFMYVNIDARTSSKTRKGLKNVNSSDNIINNSDNTVKDLTGEKYENNNVISAEPLKVNANNYYFIIGKKVIELNLSTKEFKDYATGVMNRGGYWIQVGLNGHLYELQDSLNNEIEDLKLKEKNNSKVDDGNNDRGVKSRKIQLDKLKSEGNKKNVKSRNLKSVNETRKKNI